MSRRIPRQLDPIEVRVLGSLLEKEQTTPEAYPLSLNALVAACSQKTNREPVLELTEAEVGAALERLRQDVLVWRTEGARVARWKQSVERRWDLDPATKPLLTLLLLRGPQTTGQLRERSQRMHAFAGPRAVEEALGRLAGGEEPLIRELPRRPGQKESRWTHRLAVPGASETAAAGAAGELDWRGAGGARREPADAADATDATDAGNVGAGGAGANLSPAALAARLERLEARLEELAAEVSALRGAGDTST
jgi:uncharacterized protein YceH (UPF0502 family)